MEKSYYETMIKMYLDKLDNTHPDDAQIESMIKSVIADALDESRRVGESVESFVYDVMEGLERGLWDIVKNKEREEHLLHYAANTIVETLHSHTVGELHRHRRAFDLAKARLEESFFSQKLHMEDAIAALKTYAGDHAHTSLLKKVDHLEIKTAADIYRLGEKFGYNKLHRPKQGHKNHDTE